MTTDEVLERVERKGLASLVGARVNWRAAGEMRRPESTRKCRAKCSARMEVWLEKPRHERFRADVIFLGRRVTIFGAHQIRSKATGRPTLPVWRSHDTTHDTQHTCYLLCAAPPPKVAPRCRRPYLSAEVHVDRSLLPKVGTLFQI